MPRPRRGSGSAELVVSLFLFLLLSALASALVASARRRAAGVAGSTHSAQVLRHAAAPLAVQLRDLGPSSALRATDSTLHLLAAVGGAVTCGSTGPATVVVPAVARSGEPALTTLDRLPAVGDVAQLLVADTGAGAWSTHAVTDARAVAAASCAIGATTLTARAPLVVTLHPAPPATVGVGVPVRFATRLRYSLYRGGDDRWQLGLRRCGADSTSPCAIVQPVAGPLAPWHADPSRRGLRIEPLDATGGALPLADAGAAAALRITLRAPRVAGRAWVPVPRPDAAVVDSLVLLVAARNRP